MIPKIYFRMMLVSIGILLGCHSETLGLIRPTTAPTDTSVAADDLRRFKPLQHGIIYMLRRMHYLNTGFWT